MHAQHGVHAEAADGSLAGLACLSSSIMVAHCQGEEMKLKRSSAARQAVSQALRNLQGGMQGGW